MYKVKQMKYLQGAEIAFRFVNLCVNVHTHVCICAYTCCVCAQEVRRAWLCKTCLSLSFFCKANHYGWKLFLCVGLIFLIHYIFMSCFLLQDGGLFQVGGEFLSSLCFIMSSGQSLAEWFIGLSDVIITSSQVWVMSSSPTQKPGLSCPCSLPLPVPCV